MGRRFEELDSIRGIAAFSVLLSHYLFLFIGFGNEVNHNFGFLSPIWNSTGPVIMFFVLSGFVLSLGFIKDDPIKYSNYLIRRICRIYLPYLLIVIIAIVVKINLIQPRLNSVPNLFMQKGWYDKINLNIIINHVLFLGEYNHDEFLMVIWTLIHEIRISLIFPFIILLFLKMNWKFSIGITVLLSPLSYLLVVVFPTQFTSIISSNYFITLHYLTMFIFGFLIAKNRDYLINFIQRFKLKLPIFFMGLVLFNYPSIPYSVLAKITGDLGFRPALMIEDWIMMLGSIMIIIIALSSNLFSIILLIKPLKWLGKVSYSLYLIHPVVVLTITYMLFGKISIPLILLSSLVISLLLAGVVNNYIEQPSIKLGRYLSIQKRFETKQKTSA